MTGEKVLHQLRPTETGLLSLGSGWQRGCRCGWLSRPYEHRSAAAAAGCAHLEGTEEYRRAVEQRRAAPDRRGGDRS